MTDEEIKAALAENQSNIEAGVKALVPQLVAATLAPLAKRVAEIQRDQPTTIVH